MHRGHDRDHVNGGGGAAAMPPAHNRGGDPRRPVQWQTAHRDDARIEDAPPRSEPDLDLVEAAFTEGFVATSDPTSFLRLARVPFEGTAADGTKLALLRVEIEAIADVGSITPHLGGASFRYDPLPARMVSRRKRLRFVYFDGHNPRTLGLAEALTLAQS